MAVGLKIRFLAPGLYEAALHFMGSEYVLSLS